MSASTLTGMGSTETGGKKEDLEDTLESHEVIELHAFLERKEWIDEKIKFLEGLPPIPIFAGTKEIGTEYPPDGLPTRAQLNEWQAEHDRIEKETEIFDSGDLRKLKKLTKAATQKNLSPEDTDLIELTLTTLFTLDKLLHLLRDRSDALELLGLRLSWEEHRAQSYAILREILEDTRLFLKERGTWSRNSYSNVILLDSEHSPSSDSNSKGHGLTRSLRFQVAEGLSKDAVQFSGRVTALRHGHVAAAGKILDRLIDLSRSPVPETMLDEQDQLEDRCSKELETVGRFAMAVVNQWKRADEIYVETKRDHEALSALDSELDLALAQHPTRRTEGSISSRLELTAKRLTIRQAQISSFPAPSHVLFPEHYTSNAEIRSVLSSDIEKAISLAEKITVTLDKYRKNCEVIERAEHLCSKMILFSRALSDFVTRFKEGFPSLNGADGSPVDLTSVECLDPLRFSTFLALLPSCSDDCAKCEGDAEDVVTEGHVVLTHLNRPGIPPSYREDFDASIANLQEKISLARSTRSDTSNKVILLCNIRRIWVALEDISGGNDSLWLDLTEGLTRARWKQESNSGVPLTPESPGPILFGDVVTPEAVGSRIEGIMKRFSCDVSQPLSDVRDALSPILREALDTRWETVHVKIIQLRKINVLWSNVRRQSESMVSMREEVHALENRIEEAKLSYDELFQEILSSAMEDTESVGKEMELSRITDEIRDDVEMFLSSLPHKLPFISGNETKAGTNDNSSFSLALAKIRPSFDPASIDRVVRSDSNVYAMRIGNGLQTLQEQRAFCNFYKIARNVDRQTQEVRQTMSFIEDLLRITSEDFELISHSCNDDHELTISVSSLIGRLADQVNVKRSHVAKIIMVVRESLAQMRSMTSNCDDSNILNVSTSRSSSLDDLDNRWHRIFSKADNVLMDMYSFRQACMKRISEAKDNIEEEECDNGDHGRDSELAIFPLEDEDVFGSGSPCGDIEQPMLLAKALRERIALLSLSEIAHPNPDSSRATSCTLPTISIASELRKTVLDVQTEMEAIRSTSEKPAFLKEMFSLQSDVESSMKFLVRIDCLAKFSNSVSSCDSAFSDLLDLIDKCPLLKECLPSIRGSLGEQLSDKLASVKGLVGDMAENFAPVSDDLRTSSENQRLSQAWEELMEMALEKLGNGSSRPGSVAGYSSGRSSRASVVAQPRAPNAKRSKYQNLSLGGSERKELLSPPLQRRAVSSSLKNNSARTMGAPIQTVNKFHSNRSVSGPGPMNPPSSSSSSSLYNSTFASRQRTTSLSSVSSVALSLGKRTPTLTHRRPSASQYDSTERTRSTSVSSSSRGTWARAPRQSFGSGQRPSTPQDKVITRRTRKYVANPANKLDVAVGDVINNLPVDINVEVVADTWKDLSGKYWIGGSEPKLCFCRILRSQTVMVRVGGGWVELSRFIKDHFADLFRIMPESPPRTGPKEEKWISASTMKNESASGGSTLRIPESPIPFLPSFAISTPDGSLTQAFQTNLSIGSPLTPMQFLRRADDPPELSLSSPSLALSSKSTPGTPAKPIVWRP